MATPHDSSAETSPNSRGPTDAGWACRDLETLLQAEAGARLDVSEKELLRELADALGASAATDPAERDRTAAAASALIAGLVSAGRLPGWHARAIWDALCMCGELPYAARRLPMRLLPSTGSELD